MSPKSIFAFPIVFLLMPLGDLFLNELVAQGTGDHCLTGIFSIVLPVFVLLSFFIKYATSRINLFKLLLPRLFLGILFGWLIGGTDELWKAALSMHSGKIVALNLFVLFIIFLSVITEIRNKLVRQTDKIVFKRSVGIVFLAMVISFTQGFYVIQMKLSPSQLETLMSPKKQDLSLKIAIDGYPYRAECDKLNISCSVYDATTKADIGHKQLKLFKQKAVLIYIWKIHLTQFMMSILIGVVLQLLWEDRPITEPL